MFYNENMPMKDNSSAKVEDLGSSPNIVNALVGRSFNIMKWSEPKSPTPSVSHYDHVQLMTPLGNFIIEWKSWKESPSYDIMLRDTDWIGCEYSLEDAKMKVKEYLMSKHKELSECPGLQ